MDFGLESRICRALLLAALGCAPFSCSALNHDCVETRDCPEPSGPIDAGATDDWWNRAAAGQAELGADSGEAGAAGAHGEGQPAAGEAGSSSASNSDAPRIMSLQPENGALGVASDARIVVSFNQAMDAAATEASYRSADLPAALLSFSWDEGHTTLTLTPQAPLLYAVGSGDSRELRARTYHYGFTAAALAETGQAMQAVDFTFSTLRQISTVLGADSELTGNWTDGGSEGIHNCLRHPKAPYVPTVCVGDDATGSRYTGFLSFDLSPLPAGITRFESATLSASGTAYGSPSALGPNRLEQVAFGELDEAALSAPNNAPLGAFYEGPVLRNGDQLELSEDLTNTVADDYAQRALRANHSQYRLRFAKGLDNGYWDDIELPTASLRLSLTYLMP